MVLEHLAPVNDLGIYLHWPFCRRKCGYCHFYTEKIESHEALLQLGTKLVQENRRYAEAYSGWGALPQVKTFYMGGGTPSSQQAENFAAMMAELAEVWGWKSQAPEEITIEANPEDVTPELLNAWEFSGVTRISLGVQSFQDRLLRALQRPTPAQAVETALEIIKKYPWKRRPFVNLDLILGIPGQSFEDLGRDLEKLLSWDPDHVSVYGLSIDLGTTLHESIRRGNLEPMEPQLAEDLWEYADGWLEDHGWKNYEISNYAKLGSESRHNIRYWEMRPWLGIGPGASGTFPARQKNQVWPLRRKNPVLADYDPQKSDFHKSGENEWLQRGDFFLDYLITGLRLSKGISYQELDLVFQIDTKKVLAPWLEELDRRGLLCFSESRLRLNRRGRFALDRLLVLGLDLFKSAPQIIDGPPPNWPPPSR